jgi:hypothetical protein
MAALRPSRNANVAVAKPSLSSWDLMRRSLMNDVLASAEPSSIHDGSPLEIIA